jgi:hypothetical protein
VRFIDIPVPGPKQGGIFDRYVGSKTSTELIRELEDALQQPAYGVLLRPWIEYLLAKNRTRRIRRLMDRFMRITGPHTGADERVARKFALVYAAGRMAIHAGLLGWSIRPLATTRDLLRRAWVLRAADTQVVDGAVDVLLEAMRDPNRVPCVKPGAKLRVSRERPLIGVRLRRMGRDQVGLRQPGVASIVGSELVGPVMKRIRQFGAVEAGHGGKSTQQLPITLIEDREIHRKPRFLVIDPKKLAAARKAAA